MKILMLEWKSFGNEDITDAFTAMGHTVHKLPFSREEVRDNAAIRAQLTADIKKTSCDLVFSFNFFPIVSLACKEVDIPYISWIYDSPYVLLYSYTVIYPTNYIFVFDKALYLEFYNAGIHTVHYLPMAANPERLMAMTDEDTFRNTRWCNRHPVAFVGSLYTEKHQFFKRLEGISPYTEGYLQGLMAAQKQVYGYNFIQESLPYEIIEDMRRVLPMTPDPSGVETVEYLYAQYVINRQITAEERLDLLTAASTNFSLDLYTPESDFSLPGCTNHGSVDYYDFAPYVFKNAKINLNISLRSITSGIPLRAFDIMGAGGFLLSNYQADFLDFFVPGEDFAFFESKQDMLQKIEYYLAHEEERAQIAENGLRKICEAHTYQHRITEMFSYL